MYLTPAQHRSLQREARKAGVSMTELMRRIVDEHLTGQRGVALFQKDAVLSFAALGKSGETNLSEKHDEALDEAFRAGAVR
jgi:hypothetical protein